MPQRNIFVFHISSVTLWAIADVAAVSNEPCEFCSKRSGIVVMGPSSLKVLLTATRERLHYGNRLY